MLLLGRLGLRADDVMKLRLEDIDWRGGSLRLIGKGRREAWLPLPQEVGDAILKYIERSRPQIVDKRVFLKTRAPWSAIGNNASIAGIVARAIVRAGVDAPSYGAHLLRHSAATAMLREGASLDGIAGILRHRSIDTAAVYTRVDQRLLGAVGQPWTTAQARPAGSFPPPTPTAPTKAIAQPWLVEVTPC